MYIWMRGSLELFKNNYLTFIGKSNIGIMYNYENGITQSLEIEMYVLCFSWV